LNFSPDLVWVKQRSGASTAHSLEDIVRGTSKHLASNATDAEVDVSVYGGGVTAFNSGGFSVGSWGAVNENGQSYVGWTWDAGTTTVSNTQGSITSSVRANATAGFSVVTWSYGTVDATVGHGLGVAPGMIIAKARTGTSQWIVYHSALGADKYIYLSTTGAAATNIAGVFSGNSSTVFEVNAGLFPASVDYVAYCFAPVSGYSNFGSYTGNGSTDGPFVYTGFRPRWVMIKASSASSSAYNWMIVDTARATYNGVGPYLYANLSDAENSTGTVSDIVDITSNGFKLRGIYTSTNWSAVTYIYCAFAESPFQYARAR
jgi:hypothetical protein